MKKVLSILGFCASILSLVSCRANSVVKFAYTTFELSGDQVAFYSSQMVDSSHVWIFENEESMPNANDSKYYDNYAGYKRDCESACIISLGFNKIYGSETVDDTRYALVALDNWYYISAIVYKNKSLYSESKSLYLNDTKLEVKDKYDFIDNTEYYVMYHFENCGLKRSNPKG